MAARAGIFTVLAAAAALGSGAAMAQTSAAEQACLARATDAERLLCLRDVRAAVAAGGGVAVPAPAPNQAAAATATAPAAQSVVPPSAADGCMALGTDAERLACMRGALMAAEASLARPADSGGGGLFGLFGRGGARPDALLTTPEQYAAGMGAEQINRNFAATSEAPVPAQVVAFREYQPGVFQFELNNGQVWRQLNGDTTKIRLATDARPAVEMARSWAGGYRMRLIDENVVVQVRRIE